MEYIFLKMMRIIGIDLGEKRIGIAVTDKLNKISYPLTVIENNSTTKEKLLKIIKDYDIGKIVIGIPYNLKGEAGYQTKKVNDFIYENFKDLNIQVKLMDERFTSKIAESILGKTGEINRKVFKKKQVSFKKGDIDKLSASILLNDYLKRVEKVKTEEYKK